MDLDIFDPLRYEVTDLNTGEVVKIQLFVEESTKTGWQKAFAKTLAEYIGVSGTASSRVLAHIITTKDNRNRIFGTIREIAEEIDVAERTVAAVFNTLYKKELLRKVRSGLYMLSPKVMRYGSQTSGAMLLRTWGEME